MNTSALPKLALIAGPTASGKSALALALAERLDGMIVNADSAQVYADLRILSARPTAAEEARVPHRLFGHVDGADASYSAARWAAEATVAIAEAHAARRLPIVVGGTGLYLRTLIEGIAPVPAIDPATRAAIRALPVAEAHARLAAADPVAADRLRATDTARVARALEVVVGTGRPLAAWQAERRGGIGARIDLAAAILLPDRAWLTARCDARFAAMTDGGAADEAAALLARRDVPADAPVRRAIGVGELGDWLAGLSSREEAIARAQAATRQYAKRQYTWFRHQPPDDWMRCNKVDPADIIAAIERKLRL